MHSLTDSHTLLRRHLMPAALASTIAVHEKFRRQWLSMQSDTDAVAAAAAAAAAADAAATAAFSTDAGLANASPSRRWPLR